MTGPETHRVTLLLDAVQEGDSGAACELLPIVYTELRRLAAARLAQTPGGHLQQTLQPTALVHEAYIRLVGPDGQERHWANRRHFFAAAAVAMRDLLVEQARRRASLKRGAGRGRLPLEKLDDLTVEDSDNGVDLVALDAAITRLRERDDRKAEIVMLRFFAGLSVEETALALSLSPATVKREWAFARALLYDELNHANVQEAP